MNISPTPIGWGSRLGGSMFQSAPFSANLGRTEPKQLGQVDQQWFARAKSGVAAYDDLWARTQRIANKTYREELSKKYHTKPEDQDGALYRRNSVAYNVSQAESYTPVNYVIYAQSQQQNRVKKLEDWNTDFREDVEYGEKQYGILPEPVIIEQVVTVTKTETPTWLLPVGIGIGALIIGALLLSRD
jgi:hypothetical protein